MKLNFLPTLFLSAIFMLTSCSKDDANSDGSDNGTPPDNSNSVTAVDLTTSTNQTLRTTYFSDNTIGYIGGGEVALQGQKESAIILKSSNGGIKWNSVYSSQNGFYITSIIENNGNVFATTSSNILLRSNDQGLTWSEITVSDESLYVEKIHFLDNNNGFIIGSTNANGRLLKTTDGGATWTEALSAQDQVTYLKNNVLHAISSYRENGKFSIVIAGGAYDNGLVLKSTDTGVTWNRTAITQNIVLKDLVLNGSQGYVVGNNGQTSSNELGEVFTTNNSGNSWSKLNTGYSNKLVGIDYRNNLIGIIGTNLSNDLVNPEFIIFSKNGGQKWERVTHDHVVAGWNDITFINNTKFIVVGRAGKAILVTIKI
jgi:photosystem II stability/assembly factor-like uncharacterized protein